MVWKKNYPSVLVTVPSANQPGGVSQLFQILRGHLGDQVDYFEVGARSENVGSTRVLFRLVKDYVRFTRILLAGGHDVVHINPSLLPKAIVRDGIFLLLSKLLRKRVLVFFHGWDTRFAQSLSEYFPWVFRWIYFRADTVIILAEEYRAKLVSMGYKGPLRIGTTAIDDGIFLRLDARPASSRLSHPRTNFNILFLSRIVKKKGVYEAIDAYRQLRLRHPEATLTVAGEGPDLDSVKAYVRDRSIPDVTFAGFVHGESKAAVFEQADVYLFPTYGEGMPISVLEAMAYGLPVVTRPVGGLRDFFENGKMGFLTESLDPTEYADALERLLADRELRLSVGNYNYEYAQRKFRAHTVATSLLGLYEEICS